MTETHGEETAGEPRAPNTLRLRLLRTPEARSQGRSGDPAGRPKAWTAWLAGLLLTAATFAQTPGELSEVARPSEAPVVGKAPAADRELLEEVFRRGGVETRPPRPSVSRYLNDVSQAAAEALAAWLSAIGDVDEMLATAVRWLLVTLSALFVTMMLWRLARVLAEGRSAREPDPKVEHLTVPGDDATDWRAELEARLDAGDAAGALEALWWWLASRLALVDVEAGCTTRELIRRARRPDLLPVVRHFDRLLYSGRDFRTPEVRQLWGLLRGHLEDAHLEGGDPRGHRPHARGATP